jgi:hypothetical protein
MHNLRHKKSFIMSNRIDMDNSYKDGGMLPSLINSKLSLCIFLRTVSNKTDNKLLLKLIYKNEK